MTKKIILKSFKFDFGFYVVLTLEEWKMKLTSYEKWSTNFDFALEVPFQAQKWSLNKVRGQKLYLVWFLFERNNILKYQRIKVKSYLGK